jgi:hypothetical protein
MTSIHVCLQTPMETPRAAASAGKLQSQGGAAEAPHKTQQVAEKKVVVSEVAQVMDSAGNTSEQAVIEQVSWVLLGGT